MKNEDTALILDEAYFKMMVQPPSQEKSGLSFKWLLPLGLTLNC